MNNMPQIIIYLLAKIRKLLLHFKKQKNMKEIMTVYYMEAKSARISGRKIAWITSGGPVEPLIAMDVIPGKSRCHDRRKQNGRRTL
ncbi:MAG: hypothetical protein A4E71_02768 [Smithella sp. PtaU1.Bin162]|nr:MAG: hypothetical protein A4E71_02768 [Smithella sp. PtaU1.Bin162]